MQREAGAALSPRLPAVFDATPPPAARQLAVPANVTPPPGVTPPGAASAALVVHPAHKGAPSLRKIEESQTERGEQLPGKRFDGLARRLGAGEQRHEGRPNLRVVHHPILAERPFDGAGTLGGGGGEPAAARGEQYRPRLAGQRATRVPGGRAEGRPRHHAEARAGKGTNP
eukprot:743522-Prorocentrum_minimum.AAC.1